MTQDHDSISANISIGGNSSGSIAVGKNVSQQHVVGAPPPPTEEERQQLDDEFVAVREQITELVPDEDAAPAYERLEELHEAVTAEEPDLATMEYANGWFARNVPQLAETVTALVNNPTIKKLVAVAGDAAVEEFRRRISRP